MARVTQTPTSEGTTLPTFPEAEAQSSLPSLSVEELARMSVSELEECYRAGALPASLRALDGSPPGRMLAVTGIGPRGPVGAVIRRLAKSNRFPWDGKRFESFDDTRGQGVNRLQLLGERYTFETRFEPSVIDGEPCVVLDYDKPSNPFFIRAIRDELREVSPQLFLGPALLDVRGTPRLMLYFAVDKQNY